VRYRIRTVTAPADIAAPVGLAEAKAELRIEADATDEDDLVKAKLAEAVDYVERFTGQVLSPRTMEMVADRFPCLPELIELPRTPVTAIVSVKYSSPDDGSELSIEESGWRWTDADPSTLRPAFRSAWPTAAAERGSVRIRFVAGYEEGLAPPALLRAVKALAAHWYTNREAVVTGTIATELPLGVMDLMRPFRRLLI
jgi:uncharacterized phiE125 gp8 family phage protein